MSDSTLPATLTTRFVTDPASAASRSATSNNAKPTDGVEPRDFGDALKNATGTRSDEGSPKPDKTVSAAADQDDKLAEAAAAPADETMPGSPALVSLMQALLGAASPAANAADEVKPAATAALPAKAAKLPAAAGAASTATSAAALTDRAALPDITDGAKSLSDLSGTPALRAHDDTRLSDTTLSALAVALGGATADATAAPADASATTFQAAMLDAREFNRATAASGTSPMADPSSIASSMSSSMATSTLDATELPQRLGERLRWLIDGGVQEARLRLHPQDLGSIDIRVRIESGSASVWFNAEHPAARAALELAMPQLRERFASDGLQLGSSSVSTQSGSSDPRGQSQTFAAHDVGSVAGSAADNDSQSTPRTRMAAVHHGLIDRYA